MRYVVTGDVHFSSDPKDEYRWQLWPFLDEMAQKYDCTNLLILGDLTVAKDRHPSLLVNRVVEEMKHFINCGVGSRAIYVIKGNHDYVQEVQPFFEFLNHIPGVNFYSQPALLEPDVLLMPNSPNPKEAWEEARVWTFPLVFAHQTVNGALASTGMKMKGMDFPTGNISPISTRIIAGDIHVPQEVGPLEYVGAPYHVNFGDKYEPRIMVIDTEDLDNRISIPTPFPCKRTFEIETVQDLLKFGAVDGDMIRVRYHASVEKKQKWPEIRQAIMELADKHEMDLRAVELVITDQSSVDYAEADPSLTDVQHVTNWAELNSLPQPVALVGLDMVR